MVLSSLTKQLQYDLYSSKQIVDISISRNKLYALTVGGHIQVYDLDTQEMIYSIIDDGNFKPTVIKVSPDTRYLATGSYSGLVNLY